MGLPGNHASAPPMHAVTHFVQSTPDAAQCAEATTGANGVTSWQPETAGGLTNRFLLLNGTWFCSAPHFCVVLWCTLSGFVHVRSVQYSVNFYCSSDQAHDAAIALSRPII